MKLAKIGSLLSLGVILALLAIAIPAAPALAATGAIIISPTAGPVGTPVAISGTGFTASSTYTVLIDGAPIFTGAITAGGALTATWFSVPGLTGGAHVVSVTTTGPDNSNPVTFTVTPQITLSSTSVQSGDSITVSGNGFGASSTVIVYADSVAQTSTYTSVSGTFNANVTVPQYTGGYHTITATDYLYNTASATYHIAPRVTINQSSFTVGAQLTISGTSFGASSTVTIYIDSVATTTTTSDTSGSFIASFAVPQEVSGSHTITAADSLANTASTTFTITPSIIISPSSFTSGSQVTVSGAGFAASSTIALSIDGAVVKSSAATTSTVGSFTISTFIVPILPGGNHSFQVKDSSNNSATWSFSVTSSMGISPQSGPPGTSIQVTGSGFGASKSIVISFDSTTVTTAPSMPKTDAGGSFAASFTVPTSSGGPHPVVASDGTLSATASFSVSASASLNPVSGPVGTSVVVSGTSFGARGTILVTYDGSAVATTTADNSGAFSATFNVPASATGTHTITVTDGTRTMPFSFAVAAAVTLSPTSGNVGTPITIAGTGFASGGQIAIKYDAGQIGTVTAGATGGFAVVFNAPSSKGGNHSVIVTDGTSTIVSTFAMDSTPPPASALQSPPDDTQADALAAFRWAAVTDPSGVTYVLQVSRDSNFSILVLEKKGLTNPGYQLTEQEKLESVSKEQPYYWHVKAIDGALNESTSPTQAFRVGFVLATWALYTIFGFSALIVGVLGFWLGSRRGRL